MLRRETNANNASAREVLPASGVILACVWYVWFGVRECAPNRAPSPNRAICFISTLLSVTHQSSTEGEQSGRGAIAGSCEDYANVAHGHLVSGVVVGEDGCSVFFRVGHTHYVKR